MKDYGLKIKIQQLVNEGEEFEAYLNYIYVPQTFDKLKDDPEIDLENELGGKIHEIYNKYQNRYSQSITLIKKLLPERLDDFKKFYEIPKNRISLDISNYKIEDFLNDSKYILSNGYELGLHTIIAKIRQQTRILASLLDIFENVIYKFEKIYQSDLYDSELDSAQDLNEKGFFRAAGTIAGVVLEGYLKNICKDNNIIVANAKPTISNYSEAIYKFDSTIIDKVGNQKNLTFSIIRNKCSHSNEQEPTKDEV